MSLQRKPIPGYEGLYDIDNYGNVWSFKTKKYLKGCIAKDGYRAVTLWSRTSAKNVRVHRLVAQLFLPNFNPSLQVDHIDRNRLNNHVDNLRLVTKQENSFNTNAKGWYRTKYDTYAAQIVLDNKTYHLGTFKTPEEAHEAYLDAKSQMHKISCSN
jgi:hypothetical protein